MRHSFHPKRRSLREPEGIRVQVSRSLLRRMRTALESSSIEEGGKLIGRIHLTPDVQRVEVVSYLDSGPRVDNSQTHLLPDGEYQESLFRVLERYDPDIEHIGSWHSHHCNGLSHLSEGDIQGYISSVNDARYGPGLFLAMLVTDLVADEMHVKYYAFIRGGTSFVELDRSDVTVSKKDHVCEPILVMAERLSVQVRDELRGHREELAPGSRTQPIHDDMLRAVRAEDRRWILKTFPGAVATRSRKTGRIGWTWSVRLSTDGRAEVRYTYPVDQLSPNPVATLSVSGPAEEVLATEVALDEHRFAAVERHIAKAIQVADGAKKKGRRGRKFWK